MTTCTHRVQELLSRAAFEQERLLAIDNRVGETIRKWHLSQISKVLDELRRWPIDGQNGETDATEDKSCFDHFERVLQSAVEWRKSLDQGP